MEDAKRPITIIKDVRVLFMHLLSHPPLTRWGLERSDFPHY
jgi:hypothetical protein